MRPMDSMRSRILELDYPKLSRLLKYEVFSGRINEGGRLGFIHEVGEVSLK